jgi:hypothetical protein
MKTDHRRAEPICLEYIGRYGYEYKDKNRYTLEDSDKDRNREKWRTDKNTKRRRIGNRKRIKHKNSSRKTNQRKYADKERERERGCPSASRSLVGFCVTGTTTLCPFIVMITLSRVTKLGPPWKRGSVMQS